MAREETIREAYRAFASFPRPEHFTDHTHCEECAEHDETMRSRPLAELGVEKLGNPGWTPLSFLTEQAYGYVMPRLIELALADERFVFSYLLALTTDPRYRNLDYFTREQIAAVLESLYYMRDHMAQVVEAQCCEDDLVQAINRWQALAPVSRS